MIREDTTTSWGRQEATSTEKKRGKKRGGGAIRGGKVETPLDGRQWWDKKLRQQRTRGNTPNTTANRDRREA